MIVLSCKYCGNCDLSPSEIKFEMFCDNCDKQLPLWETKPLYVKSDHLLLRDAVSKTSECI